MCVGCGARARRAAVARSISTGTGTRTVGPGQVIGGYQRPFGGPQLWSSTPMRDGHPEWVRLDRATR